MARELDLTETAVRNWVKQAVLIGTDLRSADLIEADLREAGRRGLPES